jgi:hypothetical protein
VPQRGWSEKRERRCERIKDGLLRRGESEERAEEIAARTVNKESPTTPGSLGLPEAIW